jgi:enoyl-CoA hydratase/carnithine racemase
MEQTLNRLRKGLISRYGLTMIKWQVRWNRMKGVFMPEESKIKIADENGIRILTIDHPPVNALSQSLLNELEGALEAAEKDEPIGVVILRGAGQTFIAGADIREIAAISSEKEAVELARRGQALFDRIEQFPKPIIASIHSVCLGGGNELVMACHIRIASQSARFSQPEINLGIMPGFGGTQRLARLVGYPKAIEWVLTGDTISAKEAEQSGLINKMVPDGDELKVAKGIAGKILTKGRTAVRNALQAITQGKDKHLKDALKLEAELFGELVRTEDMKEGLKAFIEKRQPQFKGR